MSSGRVAKGKSQAKHSSGKGHTMDAKLVPPATRAIKVKHTPVEPSIDEKRVSSLHDDWSRPISTQAGNEENHNSANQDSYTMHPRPPGFICRAERSPFRSPVHPAMNFAPASSTSGQVSPAYSSFSARQTATSSAAGCPRHLYSEPLLQTPQDALTPHSPIATGVSATKGAFFCPMTPKSSHRTPSSSTPGLDLLADQSLMHRRRHPGQPMFVNHATMLSFRASYNEGTHLLPNYPPLAVPHTALHLNHPGHYFIPRHASEKLAPVESLEKTSPKPSTQVPTRKGKKPMPRYQPPIDPVTMYPLLFREAKTSTKPCHCVNSKCLKLYCECFHKGLLCDPNFCECKECSNTKENNGAKGPREYAILKKLAKKPDAFTLRSKKPEMCSCPKTYCLKRYCECFSAGRHCTGRCKCSGCLNWPGAEQASQATDTPKVCPSLKHRKLIPPHKPSTSTQVKPPTVDIESISKECISERVKHSIASHHDSIDV
eukprot:Nitzschia sp. Nitz4//scaffold3_size479765//78397//79926//NITZ4_000029-RA/size479765-snap-gene-0.137-mRNA-1//-1//CDS//3329550545//9367//frame0